MSAEGIARSTVAGSPLSPDELNKIDAYWRANPHANAELRQRLRLPDFRSYAIAIGKPGSVEIENVPPLGVFLRDVMKSNNDWRIR